MLSKNFKILVVLLAFLTIGQCLLTIPLKRGKINKELQPFIKGSILRNGINGKLINLEDDIYLGQIQVGLSQDTFEVVFDTGSNFFWVPSKSCETCIQSGMTKGYSCTQEDACVSSEFVERIYYATGDISGNVTNFVVSIPGTKPVDYFGILVDFVQELPSGLQGIIGLTPFYDFQTETKKPNLITLLYQQKQIEKPIVSFYQAFEVDEKSGKYQSAITFGGYDETKIVEKPNYFKTIKKDSWSILIEEFVVGGVSIFKGKEEALIDNGTTSFYIRPDIGGKFFDYIMGVRNITLGDNYDVDCDADFPNVSFTFLNNENKLVTYEVEPDFYITRGTNNTCYIYFEGYIGAPTFVIGNTFLRKYLPVFDYEKKTVGFARTVNQAPKLPQKEQIQQY
ncbi:eukaryotic aspartyl protease (macronuclear) [Tetrahymena thermophila SB210]|uniref:Eukaryotic aspartyl protease n=1 Tax=Tetrahymena thermophila (strain SB210) TaxID=312017 RepID=Q235M4_TETTS|nr:eukaryotic aspartyl protease [Tetrahymena thermophila SB210]EAR92256.1 eukaryotic aspartyl protease [Tetrahymena thermophila SB210]|eukprot:XP_001012501.1 eukaryotic aspartyl protease [Tetrahymena thermophila SB210]